MEEGKVIVRITIQVSEFKDGSFIAENPNVPLSSYGTTALEATLSFLEDYRLVLQAHPNELK